MFEIFDKKYKWALLIGLIITLVVFIVLIFKLSSILNNNFDFIKFTRYLNITIVTGYLISIFIVFNAITIREYIKRNNRAYILKEDFMKAIGFSIFFAFILLIVI